MTYLKSGSSSSKQKHQYQRRHRKADASIWTGNDWTVQWLDDTKFKVEYEGLDLYNEDVLNWIEAVDYQIKSYFGGRPPDLTMSMLNFSCNNITDEGIIGLVDYLCSNRISVDKIMLHKNLIRDEGAAAIGRLLANSPRPVQEVHLSHNYICNKGICAIMDGVRKADCYPYDTERWLGNKSGTRQAWSPLWLRVENNTFDLKVLEYYMNKHLDWCSAVSRDRWQERDSPPMVCIHKSYRQQRQPETQSGASWKGSDEVSEKTILADSTLNSTSATESTGIPSLAHLREMATLVSSSTLGRSLLLPHEDSPQYPEAVPSPEYDISLGKFLPGENLETKAAITSEASKEVPYQTWLYGMDDSSLDISSGSHAANPQESAVSSSFCHSQADVFFEHRKKKGSNKIT